MATSQVVDLTRSSSLAPDAKAAIVPSHATAPSNLFRENSKATMRQKLEKEITNMDFDRLRAVVRMAFSQSPEVVNVFESLLFVPEEDVMYEGKESEEEEEEEEDDESADGNEEEDESDDESVKHISEGKEAALPTGTPGLAGSNGSTITTSTQAGISNARSHKRNLSTYSDMAVQPDSKKSFGSQRMVSRYAKCQNCLDDFDVTNNGSEACEYHPGELEVDFESSTWDDWDDNVHGHVEDMSESEYPEGFAWNCCNEDGLAPGCETGWHQQ